MSIDVKPPDSTPYMGPIPALYTSIREEIHYEHSQINSRMLWYMTSQTFLILGLAGVLAESARRGGIGIAIRSFAVGLALVGGFLSFLVWCSLQAAAGKIRWLRQEREQHYVEEPYYVGSLKAHKCVPESLHELCPGDAVDVLGLWFPLKSPWVFLSFWMLVGLMAIFRGF